MSQALCVVLGDIIGSRLIQGKEEFRGTLETVCDQINSEYTSDLFAAFRILKGVDEIGGVLNSVSRIYEIVSQISDGIHPKSMRYVAVYGSVDSGLRTHDVSKMGGPAFHQASDMMNQLKTSGLMFDFSAQDKAMDLAIAGVVHLILVMKKDRSERQQRIVMRYEHTRDQHQVAEGLNISQQAVSKMLQRLRWKEINSIEEKLNLSLRLYASRIESGGSADARS